MPDHLFNPFSEPRDLDPDTAKMVGDMLGPEAKKAFEALDKEPPKPIEKPAEPTEEEKAAMRKAEKDLMERSREKKEFPTWKTIRIGEHNTPEEMRKALEAGRFNISSLARQILEKTSFFGTRIDIEFVNLSAQELGFDDKATTQEIYDRAAELGLALCPAEAGPELRLQYPDQPIGERLCMAMEPIVGSGGNIPYVFSVEYHDVGGRGLYINSGIPDSAQDADDRWVFLRSKKK